jgi:hypothetical protein
MVETGRADGLSISFLGQRLGVIGTVFGKVSGLLVAETPVGCSQFLSLCFGELGDGNVIHGCACGTDVCICRSSREGLSGGRGTRTEDSLVTSHDMPEFVLINGSLALLGEVGELVSFNHDSFLKVWIQGSLEELLELYVRWIVFCN